ncbi:neprilysin-2-like isoform X2 [Cotesia glomerata]|uniref:neprilysin-2-like isoform X2 n=1 Tax=Cotesia glomerata TaxID=32391 RepID=UPI001D0356B7|nr:neprilysin-2-like isoform X2 [Cotesia glomerata]
MMISYLITIITVSMIALQLTPIEANNDYTSTECQAENDKLELTILKNLNTSVNPCEDFYQFACGNFNNSSANIQYSNHNDFYKPIRDRENKIKELLLNDNYLYLLEPFNSLKKFVKSCERLNVNIDANSSLDENKTISLNFMTDVIAQLGGWPILEGDEWNDTHFNWIKFTEVSRIIGTEGYFFLKPSVKMLNHTTMLSISPPGLEFPYKHLVSVRRSRKVKAYYNYILKVAQFLETDLKILDIDVEQALAFELDLIYATSRNVTLSSTEMTIKEMDQKWPNIDWIKLFRSFIGSEYSITENWKVLVKNSNYITRFEQLIQLTNKRIQANYAVWKTIERLILFTESPKLFSFQESYYRIRSPSQRIPGYNCFDFLINLLPELSLSYYERHYPIDVRFISNIENIIIDIKKTFVDVLNNLEWLDHTTKNELVLNLDSTKFVLGLTETMLKNEKLRTYFDNLVINEFNFLKNFLAINIFDHQKLMDQAFTSRDMIDLTSVFRRIKPFKNIYNAIYDDITHTVFIDIEAMRNLFFDIDRPNFTKYSIIGFTIGHELAHPIENLHDVFDTEGKIVNGWSMRSNDNYNHVRQCLIDQHHNYTGNSKENVVLSHLEENIADNIGSEIAYLTYKNWVQKYGDDSTYPRLNYTQNQSFWLSYANKWCIPEKIDGFTYLKSSHASSDFRVLESLSNSAYFAKDFNCKLGSRMNPEKKCNFLK